MSNDHERFEALERRMSTLEQDVRDWRSELSANTEATLRVERNTQELVALLGMAKTGVSFFAATGRVLRKCVIWLGPFIAFAAACWGIAHGKWPGSNP